MKKLGTRQLIYILDKLVYIVFCEMLMSVGIPVMNVEFTTLMVLKLNVSLGELL